MSVKYPVASVFLYSVATLPAVPPFAFSVIALHFAEQMGLCIPEFSIVPYPVLQLVVYVHTPFGADKVHVAPVPGAHAVHVPHTAYNVTVPPLVLVKLDTLCPFVYVADVAVLDFDHPKNFFTPFVNPFDVSALAVPYV